MVNPRALARYLALGRALLGAALLVAPGRLAVPWVGRDGSRAAAKTIARGLGARDVAIGAGAMAVSGDALRPWLIAAIAADTGDLLATLAAGDAIPARGRALVGAMAFGGAALGGVSLAGILRQRQSPS
jgi:hypothetical protein